jgi:peroxiredoxin
VAEAGGELLGISGDHLWAHKAYAKQLGNLPFPLLADWGMDVTKRYGVHNAERNAPKRVVFILDREGVVRFKNATFDPRDPGSYVQVLEEFQKLP